MRAHRVITLESDEVTELHGLPVTAPGRTLLDLAGRLPHRDLERATAIAIRKRMVSNADLVALLDRHPRHAGAARLRSILGAEHEPAMTRSEAEDRFLDLVRRAGIRAPEVNVVLFGYEVDFLWRSERLVVEVDGFAFHSSYREFESDRERDSLLSARGYRVIRATWRRIVEQPESLAVRLALALARVGPAEAVSRHRQT